MPDQAVFHRYALVQIPGGQLAHADLRYHEIRTRKGRVEIVGEKHLGMKPRGLQHAYAQAAHDGAFAVVDIHQGKPL